MIMQPIRPGSATVVTTAESKPASAVPEPAAPRQPASSQTTTAGRRGAVGAEASSRAARSARDSVVERVVGQSPSPRRGLGDNTRSAPLDPAVASAFATRIAELKQAVADGRPGAAEALRAVEEDRDGMARASADVAAQLAVATDPAHRAKLTAQLQDIAGLGLRLAKATAKERQDIRRFFEIAWKDPAAIARLIESTRTPVGASTGVPATPATTSSGIQAAIDFGLTQLGAPYVGGASPFRFGTPGDGGTYQMQGQRPYVSPKGVVGYDCSGLMVTMLKKAGINLTGIASSGQMKSKLPEVPKDQLQPGDLLVKNGHVSMYIGNGQMIESVPAGVRVFPAATYINDPDYTGHRPG